LVSGEHKDFWTTFTSNQIDIDVHHPAGKAYLKKIIDRFSTAGIKLIRLDAVGYAIKKAGTSCFMIPETYAFIDELSSHANAKGMDILVEIHSYYKDQIEIAKQVDYVYDFALPPLVLHAIYNHDGQYLKQWLDIRPNNTITVLDTHDGIGIVDVGPHNKDRSKKGILPETDIENLVEEMHRRTKATSKLATGAAASNLDLYQVNSTYYDALGQDDSLYLLARAIQFFTPGIPQVYYTGFLAEPNDMDLLAQTNVGRDINRHYFTADTLREALKRPVVKDLIALIKIRNKHDAFNGDFNCSLDNGQMSLDWTKNGDSIQLEVDFSRLQWAIKHNNKLLKIGE
jgi:sucrose phosphorylase